MARRRTATAKTPPSGNEVWAEGQKWRSRGTVKGKLVDFGLFDTEKEAYEAGRD